MAYLSPAFENDIFISYAHVNDLKPPGVENAQGWVSLFVESLEWELKQRFERASPVNVWRDKRKMGGNTLFDQEIQENIDRSAIFIALTSIGYLDELSYCPKELKLFYDKAASESYRLNIGSRSRIFNVLLQNIIPDKWPAEMARTKGFAFHDAKHPEQRGGPIPHASSLFKERFAEFIEDLDQTLRSFKSKVEVTPSRKPEAGRDAVQDAGRFKVFLGYAEGKLDETRNRVMEELRQHGVNVAPSIPPPFEAQPHERDVVQAISATHLSVHLLDDAPGRTIHDDPERKTYYRKQVELATRHAKSQMIWVPKTVEIPSVENPAHKAFLEQLERGSREPGAYNFIHEPLTSITSQILARLHGQDEDEKALRRRRSVRALLDVHQDDRKFTSNLGPVLRKRMRDLLLNTTEGDPSSNMELLSKLLRRVSVLVIIFGNVTKDWVQHRLKTAVQIVVENKCPLKLCGVYLAPVNGAGNEQEVELDALIAPFPIYLFESPDDLAEVLDDVLS